MIYHYILYIYYYIFSLFPFYISGRLIFLTDLLSVFFLSPLGPVSQSDGVTGAFLTVHFTPVARRSPANTFSLWHPASWIVPVIRCLRQTWAVFNLEHHQVSHFQSHGNFRQAAGTQCASFPFALNLFLWVGLWRLRVM